MGSALAGIRRVRRFAESEPRVDTVMVPGLRADEARVIADEIDGLHSELATLRSQLAARTEALHRIAFEPFGHAEASASEVLDAVTDCARTALSGTAQTDDVLAALTDLHDACVPAYKMGRIPAEPFVRAGNVLRARASLAQGET